jgi:hypothetical protein
LLLQFRFLKQKKEILQEGQTAEGQPEVDQQEVVLDQVVVVDQGLLGAAVQQAAVMIEMTHVEALAAVLDQKMEDQQEVVDQAAALPEEVPAQVVVVVQEGLAADQAAAGSLEVVASEDLVQAD